MKKIFYLLVAASMTMAAQATILRVSNVEGSSAPYKSISAAISAAEEGDTIMVDASSTSYGGFAIQKRVVLLGPGYWLQENGIIQEGGSQAIADGITIYAKGAVVKGMTFNGDIEIRGSQVVISRCRLVRGNIVIDSNFDNCIIHQNFLRGLNGYASSNHQITNNIIAGDEADPTASILSVTDSYIAFNTFVGVVPKHMDDNYWGVRNCTIEKNIFKGVPAFHSSSHYGDNYVPEPWNYDATMTDKEVLAVAPNLTYGAFAGDDPYILSGVPAGPVIQDMIVPTTVEKGSKMSVTIKVGVVK